MNQTGAQLENQGTDQVPPLTPMREGGANNVSDGGEKIKNLIVGTIKKGA
jgi:hypothetical protein